MGTDRIYENILEAVGGTPLVRLHHVTENLKCRVYAKCEFFNPGGSTKDRIALQMLLDAEKKGMVQPGDTLIEATSGNTGLGLALIGAVRGYSVIITMPEKMSQEKQVVLEALGAKIVRTPTEAAWDSPESHIGVAKRLQKETPRSHILDQYYNEGNIKAHYLGTGAEILSQLQGQKVDMFVAGAGTGGSITGAGRRLKEAHPDCVVVGADPVGSCLADDKDPIGTYLVEGIGYDFVPGALDRRVVDKWVKTEDGPSFAWARQLIRKEGLLVGGSSGSVMVALHEAAVHLKPEQNVVVLFADGVRNYLTKFIDNKWLSEQNLLSHIEDNGRP